MMLMLKRLGKNLKRFRRGNSGSAIIVVLVTMTFIVVLASVLLYLSLVNIQMKKIDKGAKSNFYSAESAMEEIRAGVQSGVSEAIKKAYTTVLENYVEYNRNSNKVTDQEQQKIFHDEFYTELYGLTQPALFQDSGSSYNIGTLRAFVSIPPDGSRRHRVGSGNI